MVIARLGQSPEAHLAAPPAGFLLWEPPAFCVFSPCTAGAVVPVTSVALSSPVALEKSSGADLVSRQRKLGATSYYGIGIDRCSVLANKPADFLLPSPASNGCCGNDATIPCR